jgi:hypothetical protein
MRASSAVLSDAAVRLWELRFPARETLLARTRAAYVHLDNLIAFSKRDRDGKVDAVLACWLPDEVAFLFFLKGELANAAVLAAEGRSVAAIPDVLRHMREEPERAELAFLAAEPAQLASMYASCHQAATDIPVEQGNPDSVFRVLLERKTTGVVELISNARVNYLCVKEGRFQTGYFADKEPSEAPGAVVQRLFKSVPPQPLPRVSVKVFPGLEGLPLQAPPAMVLMFRHFVWDLAELAEREVPGDGSKRAEKVRKRLSGSHDVLNVVGGPRGSEHADPMIEPAQLSESVAAWAKEYLGELEVVNPGIAPRLLRGAAREHRYALAAVSFFERLPWRIEW